jgi:hypothetical protein
VILSLLVCATATADEAQSSEYVMEGTLIMLPGLQVLPHDVWPANMTVEFFGITYHSELPPDPNGNAGVSTIAIPVPVYSVRGLNGDKNHYSPVEEIAADHDQAVQRLLERGQVDPTSTFVRIKGIGRILPVPKRPWLPGEERAIMRPLPEVYFEGAGDDTVVRRTFAEPPSVGFGVTLSLAESDPARSHEAQQGNTVIIEITCTWTGIAEREPVPQAAFLDIGRPTIKQLRGRGWVPVSLDTWSLIPLQRVDETPGPNATQATLSGPGLRYMLLLKVRRVQPKEAL